MSHANGFKFVCSDLQIATNLFANNDFNTKPPFANLIADFIHSSVSLLPDLSNVTPMRRFVNG